MVLIRTPPTSPLNSFLNGFTLISEMIKINPKMAEISQLAENLEPWLSWGVLGGPG